MEKQLFYHLISYSLVTNILILFAFAAMERQLNVFLDKDRLLLQPCRLPKVKTHHKSWTKKSVQAWRSIGVKGKRNWMIITFEEIWSIQTHTFIKRTHKRKKLRSQNNLTIPGRFAQPLTFKLMCDVKISLA